MKSSLINDLKKFYGMPPYNGASNPCVGDAYFIASITQKYGKDAVDEASEVLRNVRPRNPSVQSVHAQIHAVAKVSFTLSPAAALALAEELIKAVRENGEIPREIGTVTVPAIYKGENQDYAGLAVFHVQSQLME